MQNLSIKLKRKINMKFTSNTTLRTLFILIFSYSAISGAGQVSDTIYDNGQYIGLGTKRPEVPLDFGLSGRSICNGEKIGLFIYGTNRVGFGVDMDDSWGMSVFTNSNINFGQWNGTKFTSQMFLNAQGNFGIGTKHPAYKLSVIGDVFAQGLTFGNSGRAYNNGEKINLYIEGLSRIGFGAGMDNSDGMSVFTDSNINFGKWDGTTFTSQMFLNRQGNLGIGTKSPSHKLTVNGGIYALDLRIRPDLNNTADFVFEDGYDLMPLDKVKSHIQTYRHLPGIPSAQEMVENGVSVAEMQAKLLQKIEELTLYILEQDERIKRLEDQVNSQNVMSTY